MSRDEVEQVVSAVCRRSDRREGRGAVGITTGLQGAGGFGKTTLALMVCGHPRVRQHFRERVYVIKVGRDVRGRAAVAAKVAEATRFITGDPLEIGADPDKAGDHLGRLLAQRPPTLLVIDDVWEPEQLEPFLRGARDRCVRLVTTRRPSMLPAGATHIRVDRMSRTQARAVLTHALQPAPSEPVVEALVRATGQWALLLRLVNQVVAAQVATGADATLAARAVLERLRAAGPAGEDPEGSLDLDDPDRRNTAVRASIRAATTLLPSGGDRRFAELGVFAEDEAVPLPVVTLLWGATGDLDEVRARLLCKQMADLSLIMIDPTAPGGALTLHDVVRDYLRAELGTDIPAVNAALVDALASALPPDPSAGAAWWEVSDTYVHDHLIEHLVDAGRIVQAEATAASLMWVRTRLHQRGPAATCRDLDLVASRPALSLSRQLARAAHLLSPTTPDHALDAILCSRVTDAPHWNRAELVAAAAPALANRWLPPDLPDPALVRILSGHEGYVTGVAAGVNGAWIATTGNDKTVRIWDPAEGTLLRTLSGHTGWVTAVAVSPDGAWIATASDDGTVRIWDPVTGSLLRVLNGHSGTVTGVAAGVNGAWIATTGNDKTVRIWDPAEGTLLRTLSGHTGWVTAVAASPDGAWIATASHDKTVRIWDPADGTLLRTLGGHTGAVNAVAVSPGNDWLATASSDRSVRVWNATDGAPVRTITGHTDWINSLAVGPSGTWLATTSDDGTVRLWDPAAGTLQRTLVGHTGVVTHVAVSPDGSWVITTGYDKTVRIWETTSSTPIETLTGRAGAVTALAISSRGQLLTAGEDGLVRAWDTATGMPVDTGTGHGGAVHALSFSPDGGELVSAGDDATLRSWRAHSLVGTRTLVHASSLTAVAHSPDGNLLAVGTSEGRIHLRTASTGASLRVWTAHPGTVNALAFSPDGAWLASAGEEGTVRTWDPAEGTELCTMTGHAGAANTVAVSSDGSRLITAGDDATVRFWDPAAGTNVQTLTGHTDAVNAVALGPDLVSLASAGNDGRVLVWLIGHADPLTLMRTDSRLAACAWARDGNALFVAGSKGLFCYDFHAGTFTR
ncbi:NB-ARC domain-containing protein [Streptomyces sp. NPDC047725]|uniref:NB-ARC domain-containing protein n=1 Tax=Streptomyces sp. NPDC047725 TaxID=3365487 RepID=UPI00371C097D